MLRKLLLLPFLLSFTALPASATELLDTYVARLSIDDHFNTEGVRLKSPAAIIRQERANYHKFGKRDSEDEYDSFFGSHENRAILEAMLKNGKTTEFVRQAIVNRTPLVRVNIYKNFVTVLVLD